MTPRQIEASRALLHERLVDMFGMKLLAVTTETQKPEWSRMIEMLPDLADPGNGGILLAKLPTWSRAERQPDGWLIEVLNGSEFAPTLAEACAKVLLRKEKVK